MKKLFIILSIALLSITGYSQYPGTFTFIISRDSICLGDSCVSYVFPDTLPNTEWVRGMIASNEFILTDGNGTTANGTAVDLGGSADTDIEISSLTGNSYTFSSLNMSTFAGAYLQVDTSQTYMIVSGLGNAAGISSISDGGHYYNSLEVIQGGQEIEIIHDTSGLYFVEDLPDASSWDSTYFITKGFADTSYVNMISNTITVGKSNADYDNIVDALASITDNSSSNQYTILVYPGTYIEDNPIICKEYVSIRSVGGSFVTSVVAQNANNHLLDLSALCVIRGFNLVNVSGSDYYAVRDTAAGNSAIIDVIVANCSNGILVDNISANLNITNHADFVETGTMGKSIELLNGVITVDKHKISNSSDIDTIYKIDGSNSIATLNTIESLSPNVDVGMIFSNGCNVSGAVANFVGLNDGIILYGDSTEIRFDAVKIFNATNDGFRIEDEGANIELSLFATTITGSGRYNFFIDNDSVVVTGNGFTQLSTAVVDDRAELFAYLLDDTKDDEGLNVLGELRVGTAARPAETCLGSGDSYADTVRAEYYMFDGSSSWYLGDSLSLIDNKAVTFPNTNVNTAIYFASKVSDSLIHHGIKVFVDDSMTIGSGEVLAEYWNGSTWTEFNGMVKDGDPPFSYHAKDYFEQTQSTHINYNIEMTNDDWIANDPFSTGNARKWVRFRIATAITASPEFNQVKLHPNRTEVNSDGTVEYFGDSRNTQLLIFPPGEPFEGNMGNQTLYVDEDIGVGYSDNRFTATSDKIGYQINLPDNIDTSCPINLVWGGHSASAGSITWTIRWKIVSPGDNLYTSEPAATGESFSTTVTKTISSGILEQFSAQLDVSEAIPKRQGSFGDQIWLSLQPSTLPGNFSLAQIGSVYYIHLAGGHY